MNLSKNLHESSWNKLLKNEFSQEYFKNIEHILLNINNIDKPIYPPEILIFNAFNSTPVEKIKVIILGQDPYHNPNEAMGMSFSVPKGIKTPPSLKNIYKEIHTDLGVSIPNHGDLSQWAAQGVLLLNAILTVSHKEPGSHRKIGWQIFTDRVISLISEHTEHCVFMLWGNFAKSKIDLIDSNKHLVLTAAHPSPLARGAFFGCKHFSQANDYLKLQGKEEIQWTMDQYENGYNLTIW